jgi:hypothetical protein
MTGATPQCRLAHDDAAYVLGALEPEEQEAYAAHLPQCAACREAVGQLLALPPLLNRVVAGPEGVERVTVVTSGTGGRPSARVRRRTRVALAAGLAGLAAAAAAVGFAVWPTGSSAPPRPPTASAAPSPSRGTTVELTALRPSGMSVEADLAPVAWGTRMTLTCRYSGAGHGGRYEPGGTYSLVVRDRDGATEQVATWGAVPGRTVTVQAATAMPLDDIAALEVRDASGVALLNADR